MLDVLLPELDGLSLRQRQRGHTVPVLMLSAMGETHDRVDGLRHGADDYLAKPFDFDELLARIEALTRRAQPVASPKPTMIGQITLDRRLPGLCRDGVGILLTARETALIEVLVRANGATVSRERILSRVWQADRDTLTNIVDVQVSRLRRKLHKLDPGMTIHGVRGLGYRVTWSRP